MSDGMKVDSILNQIRALREQSAMPGAADVRDPGRIDARHCRWLLHGACAAIWGDSVCAVGVCH